MRILIIEDGDDDAEFVKDALIRSMITIEETLHVTRLADAFGELSRRSYDVAFLDLQLPDSCGLNTLEGLIRCHPRLPIVVLTGFSDPDLAAKIVQRGTEVFLPKKDLNPTAAGCAARLAIEIRKDRK